MPTALNKLQPLYAFVRFLIAENVVEETNMNYDWDAEGISNIDVSSINGNMVVDFSYRKQDSEGCEYSFNITLFDETAIYAEALLINETNVDDAGNTTQAPLRVEYGWASGGQPVPGRSMSITGVLKEYTLNFVGPSAELNIVGMFKASDDLNKSGYTSYSGETYNGNPADIVRAIADQFGWYYDSNTIVDTQNVMEPDDSTKPKTYTLSGRSYNSFIRQDLCADAIAVDGRGAFELHFDHSNNTTTVYFLPHSDALSQGVTTTMVDEFDVGEQISYSGNSDRVIYGTYNYYTGEENGEVLSFSPSYTFSAASATQNSASAVNPTTNEIYTCTIDGSVMSVSDGSDKLVRLHGNRLLGLSTATFEELSNQSQRLWALFGQQTITASMEILGDPNIIPNYSDIVVNVYTKYGIKHHTSGIYQVTAVEDSVTGGNYITSLELRKKSVDDLGDVVINRENVTEGATADTYTVKGKQDNISSYVVIPTNSDIANYAQKFLGNPYVWEGDSLTDGIDSSHFVYRVLENTGHSIGEHKYASEWLNIGTTVDKSNVQAGDILVYSGHLAIYVDENHIVHARGTNYGIENTETNPLTYGGGVISIRRVR